MVKREKEKQRKGHLNTKETGLVENLQLLPMANDGFKIKKQLLSRDQIQGTVKKCGGPKEAEGRNMKYFVKTSEGLKAMFQFH